MSKLTLLQQNLMCQCIILPVCKEQTPELALRPKFLSTFGMATEQASKLGLSTNRSLVSIYNTHQVSHRASWNEKTNNNNNTKTQFSRIVQNRHLPSTSNVVLPIINLCSTMIFSIPKLVNIVTYCSIFYIFCNSALKCNISNLANKCPLSVKCEDQFHIHRHKSSKY